MAHNGTLMKGPIHLSLYFMCHLFSGNSRTAVRMVFESTQGPPILAALGASVPLSYVPMKGGRFFRSLRKEPFGTYEPLAPDDSLPPPVRQRNSEGWTVRSYKFPDRSSRVEFVKRS